MKKIFCSSMAVVSIAFSGGDIVPVQTDIINTPSVETGKNNFYIGIGYSQLTGSEFYNGTFEKLDLDANAVTLNAGYKIYDYLSVEGRYLTTVGDINYDNSIRDFDIDKVITNKALYLKPEYELNKFSIYGLLGYGQVVANRASDSSFQWGIGVSYEVLENTRLYVDYSSIYDDNGLDSEDYTNQTYNGNKTFTPLTYGMIYSF